MEQYREVVSYPLLLAAVSHPLLLVAVSPLLLAAVSYLLLAAVSPLLLAAVSPLLLEDSLQFNRLVESRVPDSSVVLIYRRSNPPNHLQ